MSELSKDHRPKVFEEVVGQRDTVKYLSERIIRSGPGQSGERGRRGRNVLLCGSVGSGKTTLARIYARALNCHNIDLCSGSPCNPKTSALCDHCSMFEGQDTDFFREISAPEFSTSKELLERLAYYQSAPAPGLWRVIFIDEAHSLARFRATTDNLLKPIEDSPDGLVYILATSDVDALPSAIRSRFIELKIRPISLSQSRAFLERILAEEGVTEYETAALDLIARLGFYQPRNMLNILEQVILSFVTVDRVRQVFGSSDLETLLAYFGALSIGDSNGAIKIFLDWPEPNDCKLLMIRHLIILIYYRFLRCIDLTIDPLVNSIESSLIKNIVDAFRVRVKNAGLDFNDFWLRMVEFWQDKRQSLSDDTMMPQPFADITLIRLSLFHRNFADLAQSQNKASQIEFEKYKRVDVRPTTLDDLVGVRRRRKRRMRVASNNDYLDYGQVRAIINKSSFCVQAYGKQLNVRLTLWHREFGIAHPGLAAENMSRFGKAVDDWLKRRGHTVVCRITVQENDPERGFCARSVLSINQENLNEFPQWCSAWRLEHREAGPPAIDIKLPKEIKRTDSRDRLLHKECVLWLLAGMNPAEEDRDKRLAPGSYRPLSVLIGLTAKPRIAGSLGPEKRERHTSSDALQQSGLAKQVRHRMYFLSAFNDGAWDELWGDWHLKEYKVRQETMEKREVAWEEALPESRIELEEGWSKDPRKRQRKWPLWVIES